jgi:hypothetical protein
MSHSQTLISDGQAKWAWSAYSRVKKVDTTSCVQHLVCRIPREAFRQSAMTFCEVRQSSPVARYWNMSLQLFLEMIRMAMKKVYNAPDLKDIVDKVFQKVYLEWIPSEHDAEKACEYRLHAFLFTDEMSVQYGTVLQDLLNDNNNAHEDAISRPANSRRPDPLAALSDHQAFKKVTREIYFRNVCGLANGHRRVENNLDAVNNHQAKLFAEDNIANPKHIWSLKHACSNCKNPEFRDEDAHMLNGRFHFLDTKRVIRLSNGQLFTKTFLSKFLPDYQCFVDQHIKPTRHVALPPGVKDVDMELLIPVNNKDEAARPDDHRLDMNVFGENDISTLTEQEQARIDAFSSRSDFALMSENANNYYVTHCQDLEGQSGFDKMYQNTYQPYIMSELEARCLNTEANISEKGKCILKWMEVRNPPAYKHLYRFDRNLSLFANRFIKIMEEAEQYFLVSTAHREFYQVMHARIDAYRRDFGLHLNIFQTGEGATSKSFIFDLMKDGCIPGTVDQLTYETTKANAVDGNRNDVITVCHEAPPGMFRASGKKNMDNGQEAMFKERLTSNRVSCKTFYMDEASGKRGQRVTKAECIGVWFGATNDPRDEVEEALETRFHWGNFEKIKRPDKDIDDCINGERALSREDRLRRDDVLLEWQEEQARVFLIEKMIWCKVIKDVEMSAFYIIKQKFKKLYDGKSVTNAETRDWERIFIFARIQAIVTALAAVFQVEDGIYYGHPFETSQLVAVEPYLVCTEEMVYFTLTMMDSQFVHPAEHKILRKIYHNQKTKSRLIFGNPNPEDSESTVVNHNYIKIPGSLMNTCNHIQAIMGGAEGKTSANNIKAYLLSLCRATIQSRQHELPGDADQKTWPEENEKGRLERMQSAFSVGDAVYVHVKLLKEHGAETHDPVLDTIKKIRHTNQRGDLQWDPLTNTYSEHPEKRKRFLVARMFTYPGKVLREKQYYLFNTIDKFPMAAKFSGVEDVNTMKYRNVLYNSPQSKQILGMKDTDDSRQQKDIVINMDIDDWAYKQRELMLGRPFVSIENHGKRIGPNAPKNIDYPMGLCAAAKMKDQLAAVRNATSTAVSTGNKRARADSVAQAEDSSKKHKPDVYAAVGNDNLYGMGY